MKKSILWLAALMAVLIMTSSRSSADPLGAADLNSTEQEQVSEDVKDALTDFQSGRIDEARSKLEEAGKKNPDLAPAELILAQWFIMARLPQQARQAIEVTITKYPNDPTAFVALGELNLQNNCVTEAELLFLRTNEAIKAFKGSVKRKNDAQRRMYMGLSQVNARRGKNELAIQYLGYVIKADPKNSGAYEYMGRIYFNMNKETDALNAFKQAKAANPKFVQPEALMALLFQDKDNQPKAKEYMIKAINAAKMDLDVRLIAAQWALRIGDVTTAAGQADAALKLAENNAERRSEAELLRGVIALWEKKYSVAEQYFSKVLVTSPTNFAATNNLALALCESTDPKSDPERMKRATEYAELNLSRNTQNPEAFSTAAWVVYKAGDYQKAAELLQQSIKLSNGRPSDDTAYYLAATLVKLGSAEQIKQAKEILNKLLENKKNIFLMRSEAEVLQNQIGK